LQLRVLFLDPDRLGRVSTRHSKRVKTVKRAVGGKKKAKAPGRKKTKANRAASVARRSRATDVIDKRTIINSMREE